MKEPHYDGMRKLLLIIMIVVPSVPFFLVLGIGYFYFTTSLQNSAAATLNRIIDDYRLMIAAFLAEREADLRFILHAYAFDDLSSRPERIEAVFRHLQTSANAFVDIGVFDDKGVHVAYQGPYPLTGRVYADESWFREVMEKGCFVPRPVSRLSRRDPHLSSAGRARRAVSLRHGLADGDGGGKADGVRPAAAFPMTHPQGANHGVALGQR